MDPSDLFETLEDRRMLAVFSVTSAADSGAGSLRQAIADANVAAGSDTIQFDAALSSGTINLGGLALAITDALEIQGPGATLLTIQASNGSRAFENSALSRISGLTITGGSESAIYNTGSLTLDGVTISGNSSSDVGGGIHNDAGTLEVLNSSVTNNEAATSGGGIGISGGSVTLTNSVISGNVSTVSGGGIALSSATVVTITNSTISGNFAFSGGGLAISQGTMIVTGTTISGNTAATTRGGGIDAVTGALQLRNSTISGNSAPDGGGVNLGGTALAAILNSTIAANVATSSGGGIVASGQLVMVSSIVALNTRGGTASDIVGTLQAGSTHNLVQSASSAGGLTNGVDSNIVGVAPGLGTLSSNGGPTSTHALLATSPAINNGSNSFSFTTDQRGSPRVRGNAVDIGAFEFSAAPTMTSLTASAVTIVRGSQLTLTANSVADSDGTIARVSFARDLDNDGVLDLSDDLDAEDTNGADGYTATLNTAGLTLGVHTFLAVGVDNDGLVTPTRLVNVTITNSPPAMTSLSSLPTSALRGNPLTLTANGVADSDGSIVRVDFHRDFDRDNVIDPGEFLGSDTDAAGGYTFAFDTSQSVPGGVAFLAVAVDNDGGTSPIRTFSASVTNNLPTLTSLTLSGTSVSRGSTLTLTANAPTDIDGTIVRIDFYRDGNLNGVAEADELIGADTDEAGGYTLSFSTAALAVGPVTFLAVAVDNDNGVSSVSSAQATISNALPTLASISTSTPSLLPGEALTLTAGTPADADGSIVRVDFYVDADLDGQAGPGELIGSDADPTGGYTLAVNTGSLGVGSVRYLAVVVDNDAGASSPQSVTVNVISTADRFIETYLQTAAGGLVDGNQIRDQLRSTVSNVAVSDAYWGAQNNWFQDSSGDVWSLWQGGSVHESPTLPGQYQWVLTNLTDAAGLSGTLRFGGGSISGVTTGWNAFSIQGVQDGQLWSLWWSPEGSAETYVDQQGVVQQGRRLGVNQNGWVLSSISQAITPIGGAVATPASSFKPYSQSQSNGRTEFDPRSSRAIANTGMSVVLVDIAQRVFVASFSISQRSIAGARPDLNVVWVLEPLAEVPSLQDFGLAGQIAAFEQEYVTAAM